MSKKYKVVEAKKSYSNYDQSPLTTCRDILKLGTF